MIDQCKHCTYRGDLKACRAAECSHHENWYAVEQQKRIDELTATLKSFCINSKPIIAGANNDSN